MLTNFGSSEIDESKLSPEEEDDELKTVSNLCKQFYKETLEEQERSKTRKCKVNLKKEKVCMKLQCQGLQDLLNFERKEYEEKIKNLEEQKITEKKQMNELNKRIENLLHTEREKYEDQIQDLENRIQKHCDLHNSLNKEILKNEELDEISKKKELQSSKISKLESQNKTLRDRINSLREGFKKKKKMVLVCYNLGRWTDANLHQIYYFFPCPKSSKSAKKIFFM